MRRVVLVTGFVSLQLLASQLALADNRTVKEASSESSESFKPTANQDETLYEQLKDTFKRKYLSLGALIQSMLDFQPERSLEGHNGFEISRLRFRLYGELDGGHGYFIQANFLQSPAITDAKVYHRLSEAFTLDVGLFKTPFSRELLTGSANLDFVKRSQVVIALVPARQIGMHVRGAISANVNYACGLFNGNDFGDNENDNDNFLFVGRLVFSGIPLIHITPTTQEEEASAKAQVGVSVAYSKDDDVNIRGLIDNFAGERFLIGGDFRSRMGKFIVSAEGIYASLNRDNGPTSNPFGFHTTVAYQLTSNSQVLFRFDRFEADNLRADLDLIVLAYTYWSSKVAKFQANYIFSADDPELKNSQFLIQAQLGF